MAPSGEFMNALATPYDPTYIPGRLATIENQNLLAEKQKNELASYPEERAWTREERGMTRQANERLGREGGVKFLTNIIDGATLANHDAIKASLERGGFPADIIPPASVFQGNEKAFEVWKESTKKSLQGQVKPVSVAEGGALVEPSTGKQIYKNPKETKEENLPGDWKTTRGVLKEELGREPTMTEIKARIQKEAKGYDTPEEALAVSKRMIKEAGEDAALLPGYELSAANKYIPKPMPDISKRIPPYTPAPGMFMTNLNRKTGKYLDPTTGKEVTREEGISRFGEAAILGADKTALAELTKREQLINVFTNRIEANVPIVLDAIKSIENTNPRLLNQGINASKQYLVGSGKWQAAQTAVTSLSNEIQRIESNSLGIGGQGQEERAMWKKIHDPNMSLKDWKVMANMILKLGRTARKAVGDQRKELSGRFAEDVGLGKPGEEKSKEHGVEGGGTIQFKEGSSIWNIPSDKTDIFKKLHPKAQQQNQRTSENVPGEQKGTDYSGWDDETLKMNLELYQTNIGLQREAEKRWGPGWREQMGGQRLTGVG